MGETKYTELDFLTIKENLKTFLKSQDKYKDYNFDGSSLSILLDLLAYNTAYNGFYLNMLASEMFLDSASLRESIISRAKHLGYVPRSAKSLSALVDIIVEYNTVPNSLLVSSDYEFYATIDGVRYTFTPRESMYLQPYSGTNAFIVRDLELIEGKRLKHRWTVDTSLPIKQRFIIPSDTVDLSTIKVTVQNSAADSIEFPYTQFDDINVLTPDDTVYFIQAADANKYEIVFGDNILGKAPVSGNIVKIEYVASSGEGAQGARSFVVNPISAPVFQGTAPGKIKIITKVSAQGFVPRESNDSIKMIAPRSYESQNRAVTRSDYETILKRDVPIIEHIRVWGGEENDPPEYGKVFCAIKPTTGFSLNETDKQNIINSIISKRSVVAIETIIVEPEYIRLSLTTKVNYFANKTLKTSDAIKKDMLQAITAYGKDFLSGFDSDFRLSKLTRIIDDVDSSIESNITSVKIKYRITPAFDVKNNFEIQLNNKIDRGDQKNQVSSVNSTQFVYGGTKVFLSDDGSGKLFLYYLLNGTKSVVNSDVGTVNYETGKIVITDLIVSNIPNSKTYIDIIVTPKEPDVIAYRKQLLILDDVQVDVVNLNLQRLS